VASSRRFKLEISLLVGSFGVLTNFALSEKHFAR